MYFLFNICMKHMQMTIMYRNEFRNKVEERTKKKKKTKQKYECILHTHNNVESIYINCMQSE